MELLRPFDLSPQQYNVLRILKGSYPEPMRVQDISERMLDKTSNTSRLIDKLLSKKFIDKQLSRDDRRAVDIVINASGFRVLEKTTPLIEQIETFMHSLSTEDIEKVNKVLDGIRSPEENP